MRCAGRQRFPRRFHLRDWLSPVRCSGPVRGPGTGDPEDRVPPGDPLELFKRRRPAIHRDMGSRSAGPSQNSACGSGGSTAPPGAITRGPLSPTPRTAPLWPASGRPIGSLVSSRQSSGRSPARQSRRSAGPSAQRTGPYACRAASCAEVSMCLCARANATAVALRCVAGVRARSDQTSRPGPEDPRLAPWGRP